jgi:2-polyprenyl-3-methyl-5-hydroxy-6-metoxy-1,4-benzoquinol methylase
MLLFHSVAQRRHRPEIMDQPDLAPERHFRALRGLARINRWSGSARLLWQPIFARACQASRKGVGSLFPVPVTWVNWKTGKRLPTPFREQRMRLLDVATGGGDVPIRLWHKARHAGLELEIAGCDRSPYAVEYARRCARACRADVHFFEWDVLRSGLPDDYDIVASSLFLHHLEEKQAIELLRAMARAARHLVLINDLVRSWASYVLAYLGTRMLSASDVVHADGPRSVEGAFTLVELLTLARQASLDGARVTRHWPCRMLLEWERP